MSFGSLLQRIQRGLSTVELVHTSHPRWPLPPGPFTSPTVQISVLDSSFNPPTLAHLAIANTLPPPKSAIPTLAPHDFDARLLLLSVRNADKLLKAGDATYEQRMEMMVLLAQELARPPPRNIPSAQAAPSQPPARDPNVAVAIIDEPTFVGKSAVLLDFLRKRILDLHGVISPSPSDTSPSPKFTFLMGTDTIVRLFAHRYYPNEHVMATSLHRFFSPDENDSHIICIRRTSNGLSKAAEEQAEMQIPEFVQEIPLADRISFVDIGDEERTFSSSQVRDKLASREESWRSMVSPMIANYIIEHGLYSFPSY